jgi:hypothetical protein
VGFVAVQTPAFFGRVVHGRLVFERERSLELVVAFEAHFSRPAELELPVGFVERQVALGTPHDTVEHGMSERSGEITLGLRMAIDAESGFCLLEKARVLVRMNLVAPAAIDIVSRVDVPLLHVLLMSVGVTSRTRLRGRQDVGCGGVARPTHFGILHVLLGAGVTTGTPDEGFRRVADDFVNRSHEGLTHVVVAIQTLFGDPWEILRRAAVERNNKS